MKKKTFSHVSYYTDLGECKECRCHTNSICKYRMVTPCASRWTNRVAAKVATKTWIRFRSKRAFSKARRITEFGRVQGVQM